VVLQLDDVNQYLTIRPDEGIFFLLVPRDRQAQYLSRFLDGQAAEESQLD
jgi:hypothetical protein